MSDAKKTKNKFWRITNSADGKSGDLYLYEPLSAESWWGDEMTPKMFQEELDGLGDISTLNLHINSPGGDIFVGYTIGNLIRSKNFNSVAYIEGISASASTFPAICCNKVVIYNNAMMMIHKPMYGVMGYFNSDEFRGFANELDKIIESMLIIYEEKTGLSRDELIDLLKGPDGQGTWLTAPEAVEKGFADEINPTKVAASLNGNILNIGGRGFDISLLPNFPKDRLIMTLNQATEKPEPLNKENKNQKGDKAKMEIKTVDELRAEYPELVAQIEAKAKDEGAQAERARIKDIEAIAKNIDPVLVNKAKFEEPKDAQSLAFEALKADAVKAENYLKDIKADADVSGAKDVKGATSQDDGGNPKTLIDRVKAITADFDAKRRGIV